MLRSIPFLFPLSALASEPVAPGVSSGTYLQAALALSLIVALLAGTAWLARKVSGGKRFGQGGMKVVGGVALGPRERIVLLEIGDEWLVIGIVPGQIRTLHRLAKGVSLQEDDLAASAEKPFAQWLRSISDRRSNDQ
ncbi:MAG: flagellar biosynthetic protein FliO [Propionivibrio sp.]|nr:flagellar biosynthetic protein FliO [Propionivibrio sp.]